MSGKLFIIHVLIKGHIFYINCIDIFCRETINCFLIFIVDTIYSKILTSLFELNHGIKGQVQKTAEKTYQYIME